MCIGGVDLVLHPRRFEIVADPRAAVNEVEQHEAARLVVCAVEGGVHDVELDLVVAGRMKSWAGLQKARDGVTWQTLGSHQQGTGRGPGSVRHELLHGRFEFSRGDELKQQIGLRQVITEG